jgi:hypothetical protein
MITVTGIVKTSLPFRSSFFAVLDARRKRVRSIHGKLENGQWIPDALFISALSIHRKTIQSWTWLMDNSTKIYGKGGANLRELSLDETENLTGLYLWANVSASKFKQRRHKLSGGDWWKDSQAKRRG